MTGLAYSCLHLWQAYIPPPQEELDAPIVSTSLQKGKEFLLMCKPGVTPRGPRSRHCLPSPNGPNSTAVQGVKTPKNKFSGYSPPPPSTSHKVRLYDP